MKRGGAARVGCESKSWTCADAGSLSSLGVVGGGRAGGGDLTRGGAGSGSKACAGEDDAAVDDVAVEDDDVADVLTFETGGGGRMGFLTSAAGAPTSLAGGVALLATVSVLDGCGSILGIETSDFGTGILVGVGRTSAGSNGGSTFGSTSGSV